MSDLPFSKEAQVERSPGQPRCPTSGLLKRSCQCRSCINRRNRRKGARKQVAARKPLEREFGAAGKYASQTGNEEAWRMRVRVEVKSGGMAKTVDTFYRNTRSQSDAAKAVGDGRPFIAAACADGMSQCYYVIRSDELRAVLQAAKGWMYE